MRGQAPRDWEWHEFSHLSPEYITKIQGLIEWASYGELLLQRQIAQSFWKSQPPFVKTESSPHPLVQWRTLVGTADAAWGNVLGTWANSSGCIIPSRDDRTPWQADAKLSWTVSEKTAQKQVCVSACMHVYVFGLRGMTLFKHRHSGLQLRPKEVDLTLLKI